MIDVTHRKSGRSPAGFEDKHDLLSSNTTRLLLLANCIFAVTDEHYAPL